MWKQSSEDQLGDWEHAGLPDRVCLMQGSTRNHREAVPLEIGRQSMVGGEAGGQRGGMRLDDDAMIDGGGRVCREDGVDGDDSRCPRMIPLTGTLQKASRSF
jgi:hypothetical protein